MVGYLSGQPARGPSRLRKERDDLAESLAQIEAYQPGILNVAKAWLASIERTARGAADDSEWPERN